MRVVGTALCIFPPLVNHRPALPTTYYLSQAYSMCGRFSNGLPPHAYIATVEDQLRREDRARARSTQEGRNSGANSQPKQQQQQPSQGSNSNSSGSGSKDQQEKEAAAAGVPPVQSLLQENDYYPTHNVSPSSRMPIVRLEKPVPLPQDGETSSEDKDQVMRIESMRWGLLPSYTTSIPRGPDALRTINARDDSVLSGQSMWTPLLRKGKRCVVFAQGFYEWLKKPDGTRIAHFVGMLDEGKGRTDVEGREKALMPMAGLYERCFIDEQEVYSFTIITTESNKQLNFLHDRMPVILPDSQAIMTWLGARPASSREVCSLLKPYDAGLLDCYTVPTEVGKVGRDDPSFILPIKSRKDGIAAAFGRAKKPADKDVNSETHAPMSEEVKATTRESSGRADIVEEKRSQKRQLEEDEELARSLQQEEEEGREKRLKKEEVGEDKQIAKETQGTNEEKLTVKEEASGKQEEEGDEEEKIQPSSRFSPEPYNPPVSPPRPKGGYSSTTSPAPAFSPRKTGGPSKKLEEAAKGTKDIRNFFGSK